METNLIIIKYGSKKIEIKINFSDRKRLKISVYPDKKINAEVPLGKSLNEVKKYLTKRIGWITKQLNYFERYRLLSIPKQYINDEIHYYMGSQYRLKLNQGKENTVKLIGKYFYVQSLTPDNPELISNLMKNWYLEHAKSYLSQRLKKYHKLFYNDNHLTPKIIFRRMKKRWGSCSVKGTILLNTDLIKTPIYCIDYVLVHELCHLKHSNHDKEFYRLLESLLPDWEERKSKLEKFIYI